MLATIQNFGVWLDTPAGGDWFSAVWMIAFFVALILGGSRRG